MQDLKNRFKKQAEQTEVFTLMKNNGKVKKLYAGDFNNTSYSWVYNQISKDKKDTFIEAGKGFGKTFNYWFPMRIDFILTDKNAIETNLQPIQKNILTTFLLMAKINW